MVKTVMKWALRLVALVLVIGLGLGAYLFLHMRASLPWTDGTRIVRGLGSPVQVLRDSHGIPHIEADSFEDALFALGYVHAQDRLWQMTFNRRVVQGRLAELVGAQGIAADVHLRTLDLYEAARRSWRSLEADRRAPFEAYAAGVNAVLADPDFVPPPEFTLTRTAPEPWHPADSFAALKLMGLSLSPNANKEFVRAQLQTQIGADKARDLLDSDPILPLFTSFTAEELGVADQGETPPDENGGSESLDNANGEPAEQSNNWAVAASRSATGAPLLANDPHLATSQPGIFYLTSLKWGDGRHALGASLPGLPGILLGRNETAAWAMTNAGPDVQDLYVITVNPDNPDEYATEDGFETFTTRTVSIPVRGEEALTLTLRATRHGPVLNKDYARLASIAGAGQDIAMAFTLAGGRPSGDNDHTAAALLEATRARSFEEAERSLKKIVGPMQSLLYADRETIGFVAPGHVPIRAEDHDTGGLRPADGTWKRNDWQGAVPTSDLPVVVNPEKGFLVTANNRLVPEIYPHVLTRDWSSAERARRIHALIEDQATHDLASFKTIQKDTVSIRSKAIVPLITDFEASSDRLETARQLIGDWDGAYEADRPEPLIYTAWATELGRLIYADDLGPHFQKRRRLRETFLYAVLSGEKAQWCDIINTTERETCVDLLPRALETALDSLSARYGPEIATWRWDKAHQAHFPHRPFDVVPGLKQLFSRSIPAPGGVDTVNVGIFLTGPDLDYSTRFTASFRGLYDLSKSDEAEVMIATGQSGHLMSDHYDDLMPLWRDGETLTLRVDAEEDVLHRLTLEPEQGPDAP